MNKEHILREIQRTAETNGGVPLGQNRFFTETGIKQSDWRGKYWARWGDALLEAGYSPKQFQGAYDENMLLAKYVELARELGHLPVQAELGLKKARGDSTFPSSSTFKRLSAKSDLIKRVIEYCQSVGGYDDILLMCKDYMPHHREATEEQAPPSGEIGFVYLIKSGRFYKIGRTNAVGRREREIILQLPEKATTVHVIRTDDPVGIEDYWHKRFEARRKNGEWFELSAADVAAFRRRKFM